MERMEGKAWKRVKTFKNTCIDGWNGIAVQIQKVLKRIEKEMEMGRKLKEEGKTGESPWTQHTQSFVFKRSDEKEKGWWRIDLEWVEWTNKYSIPSEVETMVKMKQSRAGLFSRETDEMS